MRHVISRLSLLAAALMIMAVPVLAEDGSAKSMMSDGRAPDKNECLLVAMNCSNQVDSIQQRIDRIKKEINRGESVYTKDELRTLGDRLEDANKTLEEIVVGGGT